MPSLDPCILNAEFGSSLHLSLNAGAASWFLLVVFLFVFFLVVVVFYWEAIREKTL